jgi:sulfate adenylyltransferase
MTTHSLPGSSAKTDLSIRPHDERDLAAQPQPNTGACIWLTGLSGAGKSTTARALAELLRGCGREVTVLDGDELRARRSTSLGFSRSDRDANVLRAAALAREVLARGGIAICALISPYRSAREGARALVGRDAFVEVFVDTPLAVCEQRDPKGLYVRARAGSLPGFTGIDDPYEPPLAPEVTLDTTCADPMESARSLVRLLVERGLLRESILNRATESSGDERR